tara:strand:- start:214 stop:504 length:291 start_codon:yes stop_codon:yes gene_type:complete
MSEEDALTEKDLLEYKKMSELESEIRRQKSIIRDKILRTVGSGEELVLGKTRVAVKEIHGTRMRSVTELREIIPAEKFAFMTNSTVSHRVDVKPSL